MKPELKCVHCGTPWQRAIPDLRRKKRITWAQWNYSRDGASWPYKTYKAALLEPPPGLYGGKPPKKNKKVKQNALCKVVQENWDKIPEGLRSQFEALGVPPAEPPPPPDLPSLIKEHLQSLPQDLKAAVEKIVEPVKPEPTLTTKLKQSVGTLRQLADRKSAIQAKADAVKAQYTSLLQELKDVQSKIESAQKELQQSTELYNQQLEKEKQASDDTNVDPEELTPENIMTIMASVGVNATQLQIQDFAKKLGKNVTKRRKCG